MSETCPECGRARATIREYGVRVRFCYGRTTKTCVRIAARIAGLHEGFAIVKANVYAVAYPDGVAEIHGWDDALTAIAESVVGR